MTPQTAAALKRVCSPCLRGAHTNCTTGDRCGCETCNSGPPTPAIVWEDPPAGRLGARLPMLDTDQLALLRANPGRWAKVKTFPGKSSASSYVQQLRTGKRALGDDATATDFEFAGRRAGAGSALYVRAKA